MVEFLLRSFRNFSSFLEWLKLFSLSFGIVVVVFAGRWWSEELLQRNRFQTGPHVLDIDSWSHSDATMKDLWRRFSWRFNGWSRSWFKIMLWSWGPFVCQETNLFICVMKLIGLQVLDLLARKFVEFLERRVICYSSIAMVDEWNASVLSACFRSPLQFNCKLVRYCNWLSFWTPSFWFSPLYPLVWISDIFASSVKQTLNPDPWEGLVELLLWVCVNIVMFILTITFDLVYLTTLRRCRLRWTSARSCHVLVYSAVSDSLGVFVECCYVAEGLVISQELKIKQ